MPSVLLVEDDKVLAETTRALLEWEGYSVRLAQNGLEALEDLRTRPRPCLVLLDLMMPVMNGWEFMGAVQRDPVARTLPIVVISAVADKAPAGTTAVLHKPFEMERLLQLVEAHCPVEPSPG